MASENVEINLEKLELIAKYYEFPLAVFFTPTEKLEKMIKGKTRETDLMNCCEKLEKIQRVMRNG